MLGVMAGFFAMSLNMGILMDTRTQLQGGSDSAALAAAGTLDGTVAGLAAARQAAALYIAEHRAFDQAQIISASADVTFGKWYFTQSNCVYGTGGTSCFQPFTDAYAVANPRKVTAVKVNNGRDGTTHNAAIDLPFGNFVGTPTAMVRSEAVAIGPGPSDVECSLPLALPECRITNSAGATRCGETFTLTYSDATADGIGFINLYYPEERQAANPNWVVDEILRRGCDADGHEVSDNAAKLFDGNAMIDRVIQALRGYQVRGQSANYTLVSECLIGKPITMSVINGGCPLNPYFHNVQSVVGFITVTILYVTDNGGNSNNPNQQSALGNIWDCTGKTGGTGPKRSVTLRIDCQTEDAFDNEILGGGPVFDESIRPKLVQ